MSILEGEKKRPLSNKGQMAQDRIKKIASLASREYHPWDLVIIYRVCPFLDRPFVVKDQPRACFKCLVPPDQANVSELYKGLVSASSRVLFS